MAKAKPIRAPVTRAISIDLDAHFKAIDRSHGLSSVPLTKAQWLTIKSYCEGLETELREYRDELTDERAHEDPDE